MKKKDKVKEIKSISRKAVTTPLPKVKDSKKLYKRDKKAKITENGDE